MPLKLNPRKPRKRKFDYEGKEQEAFFNWLYYQYRDVWEMAYHVPNGGNRSASEGAKFKKQGVKAGVADIVIDFPCGEYHGLRIELKATPPHNCAVSKSQKEWIEKWTSHGYKAVAAIGLDEARKVTENYLKQ